MDTEHYSLLDDLRDIFRYPAILGMRLAAALVVATALTFAALLITYLANLLQSHGWARILVTVLGSLGLVFVYYYFVLPYLLLIRTAHISVLARLRSKPTAEIEKNPIITIKLLLTDHFSHIREIFALFWLVMRILKAAHRRLIDISTVIPWLRKIKASRAITEVLGGIARHLAAAVIGRVIQADKKRRDELIRRTILFYAIHWKEITPIALRAQIVGLGIWVVLTLLFFIFGLTVVGIFAGFWLGVITFVVTLASARLISHACYDALGEIRLLNALRPGQLDSKDAEIWDKRLSNVSREYRQLQSPSS